MKTKHGVLVLLAFPILMSAMCNKEKVSTNNNTQMGNGSGYGLNQAFNLPAEPLSAPESESLLYMREEEKLARDVYKTLYAKWGSFVFSNIQSSEQRHMDAVKMLINKYGLTDPVVSDAVGVFTNTHLQQLYDQLVAKGSVSVAEAFQVGATIEDLDLFDLAKALQAIDNQDIRLVYDNLSRGSRNHLRAFYSNILAQSGTYTPQFIDQVLFDSIVNSGVETGRG